MFGYQGNRSLKRLILLNLLTVVLCATMLGFVPLPTPAHAYQVWIEITAPGDDQAMRVCVDWVDPMGHRHYSCTPWVDPPVSSPAKGAPSR